MGGDGCWNATLGGKGPKSEQIKVVGCEARFSEVPMSGLWLCAASELGMAPRSHSRLSGRSGWHH